MTTRRDVLRTSLFGAGAVGLRALATGLPLHLLTRSPRAWSQVQAPKRLILVSSSAGDPINANCPGAYIDGIAHPTGADFQPAELRLGDRTFIGARAWSRIPQRFLDRTCFLHHGTYTNAHGNHEKVMALMGAVDRGEMMISAFAKHLGPALQTVQTEPVNVGAPLVSFQGRRLAELKPRSIKAALANDDSDLFQLRSLRDQELDRMYSMLKAEGTPDQRRLLDRFAQTRNEARSISDALLTRLDAIGSGGDADQARAVAVLAAMNISPALTLCIRFGSDNHSDVDLAREVRETQAGVDALALLFEELEALGLQDDTVVATLNVFGRTLAKKGTRGRDHNPHHHVMMLTGPGVRPGVVGGLAPKGNDFGSLPIDPDTGEGAEGAAIPYEQSLESAAKTLGRLLGIDRATLDAEITGGRPIPAIVAG